jgi:DNA primase large subunit
MTLQLYKKMAISAQKQGVPFADTSVYTNRRLWRLVNSINSKSGLYKVPISQKELLHLSADNIMKLAEQPRSEEFLVTATPNRQAIEWYQYALSCIAMIKEKSTSTTENNITDFKRGWRTPPCIKNILQNTLPDGIRHNAYISIARFYSWINMHPKEIAEKLNLLDQNNPIRDPKSIQRITLWAAEHPGFAGCDNEALTKYCSKENCFYHRLKPEKKNKDNHSTVISKICGRQTDRPRVTKPFSSEAD